MFLFVLIRKLCWFFTKQMQTKFHWIVTKLQWNKEGLHFATEARSLLRGQLLIYKVSCEQHPASFQPFWYFSSGMAAGLVKHDLGAALTLATLLWPTIFFQCQKTLSLERWELKSSILEAPCRKRWHSTCHNSIWFLIRFGSFLLTLRSFCSFLT